MVLYILEIFKEYIFAPLMLAFCAGVVLYVKKYVDKKTRRSSVRDELESLQVSSSIRGSIIAELDGIVKAAVATNMGVVEELKSNGRKLTDEESAELNQVARTLIMNSLPTDIKDPEGRIMSIIGGEEALNALIRILIEKHVYEYKPQSYKNIETVSMIFDDDPEPDAVETNDEFADTGAVVEQYTFQEGAQCDEGMEGVPFDEIPVVDVPTAILEGAAQQQSAPSPSETFTIPDVYKRGGIG